MWTIDKQPEQAPDSGNMVVGMMTMLLVPIEFRSHGGGKRWGYRALKERSPRGLSIACKLQSHADFKDRVDVKKYLTRTQLHKENKCDWLAPSSPFPEVPPAGLPGMTLLHKKCQAEPTQLLQRLMVLHVLQALQHHGGHLLYSLWMKQKKVNETFFKKLAEASCSQALDFMVELSHHGICCVNTYLGINLWQHTKRPLFSSPKSDILHGDEQKWRSVKIFDLE
ncbi:hypothetical protein llap_12128 [Limosa lapponica baueri]|uniref:Uncharacterized protein n=1 Tax=Limosa lapponica baueri TaxID=1758121 RepID=A0A2I0TUT6_LIMLA|nr:hypothetical protein llap_12128 [Limosa lapponica baueri]